MRYAPSAFPSASGVVMETLIPSGCDCDLFGSLSQGHDLSDRPHMLTDTRFHRGSDSQGLMNPGKVVIHVIERNRMTVILNRFAEGVREPGEAADTHSHA